jgi:hypothetical protein
VKPKGGESRVGEVQRRRSPTAVESKAEKVRRRKSSASSHTHTQHTHAHTQRRTQNTQSTRGSHTDKHNTHTKHTQNTSQAHTKHTPNTPATRTKTHKTHTTYTQHTVQNRRSHLITLQNRRFSVNAIHHCGVPFLRMPPNDCERYFDTTAGCLLCECLRFFSSVIFLRLV